MRPKRAVEALFNVEATFFMTLHELQYCRFLLRCVKDLYIERSAMSTILDSPRLRERAEVANWRSTSAELSADAVYRSAIEANFAPLFEKLESAVKSEQLLASLLTKCNVSPIRIDQIKRMQGS
jgi:hypothetical protein